MTMAFNFGPILAPPLKHELMSSSITNVTAAATASASSQQIDLPSLSSAAHITACVRTSWPYPHSVAPLELHPQAESWACNWHHLQQAAWTYNLDPSVMAMYHNAENGLDGPRRKNASRETTSMLKAWLSEHRKNPYPTKGEKIMLAIITKMSLTQVSTWFANARRRLKKENKMTWAPRNRSEEDHSIDREIDCSNDDRETSPDEDDDVQIDDEDDGEDDDSDDDDGDDNDDDVESKDKDINLCYESSSTFLNHSIVNPTKFPQEKPKIWSLVDTATNQITSSSRSEKLTPESTRTTSQQTAASPSPAKLPNSYNFTPRQDDPIIGQSAAPFSKGYFGHFINNFLPFTQSAPSPANYLQYSLVPMPPLGLQPFNNFNPQQSAYHPHYADMLFNCRSQSNKTVKIMKSAKKNSSISKSSY